MDNNSGGFGGESENKNLDHLNHLLDIGVDGDDENGCNGDEKNMIDDLAMVWKDDELARINTVDIWRSWCGSRHV